MNLKKSVPSFLILMAAPLFAQVQLFEQDMSGIVPKIGFEWNSQISHITGTFEYNIEGRTTLGCTYLKPMKDTLTFDNTLKGFGVDPYVVFEFVEPSLVNTFSFAVKAGFSYAGATAPENNLHTFSRYLIHGGPQFAFRFLTSETFALIPTVGYDLGIGKSKSEYTIDSAGVKVGRFPKKDLVWHTITGSVPMNYKISEFNGLVFEPVLNLKIGEGLKPTDFINVAINFGYVRYF